MKLPYSFFFRVDVSTDLGGKSAILGAWEENWRKSEEMRKFERISGKRGGRGGTRGKGSPRSGGRRARRRRRKKTGLKSEKLLKTCIFSACGGLLQYPICGSDAPDCQLHPGRIFLGCVLDTFYYANIAAKRRNFFGVFFQVKIGKIPDF